MTKILVHKSKTNIVRTVTNSGLPSKYLVCMMQGVHIYKQPSVHIIKYVLVDHTDTQTIMNLRYTGFVEVKRFKGKYLYRQMIAFRHDTFDEIIKALDPSYKQNTKNHGNK